MVCVSWSFGPIHLLRIISGLVGMMMMMMVVVMVAVMMWRRRGNSVRILLGLLYHSAANSPYITRADFRWVP